MLLKKGLSLLLFMPFVAYSQVGINTQTPHPSSVLDVTSPNKGVVLPRIALSSTTDQTTISSPVAGLMVYNTGTAGLSYVGYVFWNGSEWRSIAGDTLTGATLSQINCGNASLNPPTYTAGVPYSGTMSLPYFDGNGGNYAGGTSVTQNGLTFKLLPGHLNVGSGSLSFSVSGTPTVSSPTPTNVIINSTLVPFYSGSACTTQDIGIGKETLSGTSVSAGYDIKSTTPTDSQTCFDGGNFCVRYNGTSGNQPLQIKQNYSASHVMLAYSYWGTGAGSSGSGTVSLKNTNLAVNTWTDIYSFGGVNNTEGATTTVILVDKTTAKIHSFLVEADVVVATEIGAAANGFDKLFLKLTKN